MQLKLKSIELAPNKTLFKNKNPNETNKYNNIFIKTEHNKHIHIYIGQAFVENM